jgi:hypothetical protein
MEKQRERRFEAMQFVRRRNARSFKTRQGKAMRMGRQWKVRQGERRAWESKETQGEGRFKTKLGNSKQGKA